MNAIEIYYDESRQVQVAVRFEKESVWLTLKQLTTLFDSSKSNISEHISHIFTSDELQESATVRKFRTVQKEGRRSVTRSIEHFNLDVIIAVGYRVNSKKGTQFRQWATGRLLAYLVKGYAFNEMRLKQVSGSLEQLEQTMRLLQNASAGPSLPLNEAKGLLDILAAYTRSFVTLNRYDSRTLEAGSTTLKITYELRYGEARKAIETLKKELIAKKEASALFGNEKDDSFKGILKSIVQTFDKQYLYASIEEQASHLLYFVIKNHPFTDGNKRIGAFLFVWFLDMNKHRFTKTGELKINSNGLTALALLVAQSDPAEKELMILLIINLINQQ